MSTGRARQFRGSPTEAEKRLWTQLRRRELGGFYFRRQVPLGPYVADFVCKRQRLIIELDGGQHARRKAYDSRRTIALVGMGYEVLRFWNNEVFENMDGVSERILATLVERDQAPPKS